MMRRVSILILLALLAGCSTRESGIRDASVPMQAVVGFQPALAAGLWTEVAAIGRQPGGQWLMVLGGGNDLVVTAPGISADLTPLGPGRMALNGREIRVLWVDTAYRTLVMGDVEGSFVTVLNETPELPADRAVVVREILGWNGYDVSQLR